MLQDHFTDKKLNPSIWQFCNMTTPCLEVPYHSGDSYIALPEHDMWNEGNCLLSRIWLQEKSCVAAEFAAGMRAVQDAQSDSTQETVPLADMCFWRLQRNGSSCVFIPAVRTGNPL